MKANELRIGNYYNQFGNIYQVNGHIISELEKAPQSQLWCKPIPLKEEWLIKLGFEKSKVSSHFYKEKLTIQIANELEYHKKGRVYFNSWAILEECIKYVHELQNLYFAITNEELTMK